MYSCMCIHMGTSRKITDFYGSFSHGHDIGDLGSLGMLILGHCSTWRGELRSWRIRMKLEKHGMKNDDHKMK